MNPNLMSKKTVGIIYAIKRGNSSRLQNVISFMSQFTNTPPEHYNIENLTIIVKQAFMELLDHVEHPSALFSEFFRYEQAPWKMSDFDAMCAAIDETQVKRLNYDTNEYEYINGFRKVEEYDSYY